MRWDRLVPELLGLSLEIQYGRQNWMCFMLKMAYVVNEKKCYFLPLRQITLRNLMPSYRYGSIK